MASPFELIAENLQELGVIGFFLPWLITATIFWGLLRKSKIFESSVVNAIISLSASFFVFSYLYTGASFDVGTALANFVTQATVIIIVFLFSLIGASMFYPKFGDVLTEKFKGTMIWIFISIFMGALFFTSGLYVVLNNIPVAGVQSDVYTLIIILVALIIGMLILVGVSRSMGGKGGE